MHGFFCRAPALASPSCPAQGDGEVSFCGAIEMSGFLELRCGAMLLSIKRLNTTNNAQRASWRVAQRHREQ